MTLTGDFLDGEESERSMREGRGGAEDTEGRGESGVKPACGRQALRRCMKRVIRVAGCELERAYCSAERKGPGEGAR
jgi:hypothetical protein